MTHFSQQDNFSVAARVLGALFYYAPESAEAAPLVAVLTNDSWETQWPLPEASLAPLVTAFRHRVKRLTPRPGSVCLSARGHCRLRREIGLAGSRICAVWRFNIGTSSVDARERHSVRNEAKRTGRSFWFTAADGCVVGGEWSPDRMRRIAGMAPFSVVNTFS